MMVRRYGVLAAAFVFVIVLSVRSNVAASAPCPGDELIWVSHGMIYRHDRASRHLPGHDACLRQAMKNGARRADAVDAKIRAMVPPVLAPAPVPPSHAVYAAPPPLPPAPAPEMPGPAISDSVYDVVDRRAHAERPGYGRYTYVLLTNASERDRNLALLSGILASTPSASTVAIDTAELNVFEIPETAPYFELPAGRASADATLATYDFGFAHDLLHKACKSAKPPRFCLGDLAGPFLLTYGRPLGAATVANPPYLVVDLHRFNAHGFEQLIGLMKEQVKRSDFPDGRLVEGFGVHLLSFILDVSDWLPGLTSDAKHIVDVVPSH